MKIPNFHDGYFHGLWIGPDKLVHVFLRASDRKSFTLALQGVDALSLSDVKKGNIIFDLVFRSAHELTSAEIVELYGVAVDSQAAANLLRAKMEQRLQLLEINASYGAQGLVLFQTFEIRELHDTHFSPAISH